MLANKQVTWPASRSPVCNASVRVPGTSLSVAEVCAILTDRHGREELFRRFPHLDPNDLRDVVERGSAHMGSEPCGACEGVAPAPERKGALGGQDPTAAGAATRFCHPSSSCLGEKGG